MQSTGRVQQSTSGTTFVTLPASRAAFRGNSGTFVTFEVPASSLAPSSTGTAQFTASGLRARFAAGRGEPVPEFPAFRNLQIDP